ncbi:unnamed protein product [Schistosoma turkestanicum]|nr:unnamed protein product [Schistosoma turkestanicum]
MVEAEHSERNYNSALVELENDRYDLMQQLDEMKLINHESRNEIFSVRQKLQATVQFSVNNRCSWMNNDLSLDRDMKHVEQKMENELNVQPPNSYLSECDRLLVANIISDTKHLDDLKTDCKSLMSLLETSRMFEAERIKLQAEMDRRLSESERNYNSALVELENDRYDLMQQLDEMKLINHESRNEIFSVRQKLQATEKFLNEQMEERELEREEFCIELNRLKSELETRKSQAISSKFMSSGDTDFCTTPLSMEETEQNNFTSHKMVDLKMENLCQNDSIKSNVQSFVQSKSWNKPSDSDEDIVNGNLNEITTRNQYKCVDQQNDWLPYTIPTMNKNNTCVDSMTNTSESHSIQDYTNEIETKQMKLIDVSSVYIQDELNHCDACTQIEVIKLDKFVEATIDSVDMEVQIVVDSEVENREEMVPLSELSSLVGDLMDSEDLNNTLREEISSLTKQQIELQLDNDNVHKILMEHENDATRVNEELIKAENKCKSLSNQLLRCKDVIVEQDEDLFLVREDKIPVSLENQNVVCYHLEDFQTNNEEDYIRPMWATSAPKKEESPNSTFISSESDTLCGAVSAEFNTLSNRLEDDSARLETATAIASPRQSVCDRPESFAFIKPNDNEETTVKVKDDESGPSIIEMRNSYGDSKAAIIHNNPWISKEQSNDEDNDEIMKRFMNQLLVALTKALDTDEEPRVSAITSSAAQTCDKLRSRTTLSVPDLGVEFPSGSVLCQIIQQLTKRISSFMRREDEFRKFLIEVLHVEDASFKSELKTHVIRSDALMREIIRLTKVVNSLSEELNHANNRTNEAQNQLCFTKVDLVHTMHELKLKNDEVERQRTDVEQLRLQLCEENAQTEKFRSELEMLQSDKVQVEHELSSSNNLIQELKISLTNEKNRAESLKIELDQLHDRIKKNTYHTTLMSNNIENNNIDISSENATRTDENRAPNGPLSDLNLRVYEALNLTTTRLASSRHDAIKLLNQVKELQATAHGLRLDLSEAELRLMPTLASVLPNISNRPNVDKASQSSMIKRSALQRKLRVYENQSELIRAKFAKLKSACVDLLPRISMDGRGDDDDVDDLLAGDVLDRNSNSHSSGDSFEGNIFIGSDIVNSLRRRAGRHRIYAERDEYPVKRNTNIGGMLNKGSYRSIRTTDRRYPVTQNSSVQTTCTSHVKTMGPYVNVTNSNRLNNPVETLPIMTASMISSSTCVHVDPTVSVERYSEDVEVESASQITPQMNSKHNSLRARLNPARSFRTLGRVFRRMKRVVSK